MPRSPLAVWYPGSGLTWAAYLQECSLHSIPAAALDAQTQRLVATTEQLAEHFGASFDPLTAVVTRGSQDVERAARDMQADFNYHLGLVQLRRMGLKEVLCSLDDTARQISQDQVFRDRVRIKEYCNYGFDKLEIGLYRHALEYFQRALSFDTANAAVHLVIGRLLLYGTSNQPSPPQTESVIDVAGACDHLENAIVFGRAEAKRSAKAFQPIIVSALYHASVAYLARVDSGQVSPHETNMVLYERSLKYAREAATEAVALGSTMPEAQYQVARVCALLGRASEACSSLEAAVRADPQYAVKASIDGAFAALRKSTSGSGQDPLVWVWLQLKNEADRCMGSMEPHFTLLNTGVETLVEANVSRPQDCPHELQKALREYSVYQNAMQSKTILGFHRALALAQLWRTEVLSRWSTALSSALVRSFESEMQRTEGEVQRIEEDILKELSSTVPRDQPSTFPSHAIVRPRGTHSARIRVELSTRGPHKLNCWRTIGERFRSLRKREGFGVELVPTIEAVMALRAACSNLKQVVVDEVVEEVRRLHEEDIERRGAAEANLKRLKRACKEHMRVRKPVSCLVVVVGLILFAIVAPSHLKHGVALLILSAIVGVGVLAGGPDSSELDEAETLVRDAVEAERESQAYLSKLK